LRDRQQRHARIDHGVAIAKLRRDIDLRRDPRQLLAPGLHELDLLLRVGQECDLTRISISDDDLTLESVVRWTADHGGRFVLVGALKILK
jgi:hypothetical protein